MVYVYWLLLLGFIVCFLVVLFLPAGVLVSAKMLRLVAGVLFVLSVLHFVRLRARAHVHITQEVSLGASDSACCMISLPFNDTPPIIVTPANLDKF